MSDDTEKKTPIEIQRIQKRIDLGLDPNASDQEYEDALRRATVKNRLSRIERDLDELKRLDQMGLQNLVILPGTELRFIISEMGDWGSYAEFSMIVERPDQNLILCVAQGLTAPGNQAVFNSIQTRLQQASVAIRESVYEPHFSYAKYLIGANSGRVLKFFKPS